MYQSNKPDRERVRQWLKQELAQHRPPPEPREIRRQLGWDRAEPDDDQPGRLRS